MRPLISYVAKVLPVPRNCLMLIIFFFTLTGAYIGQNYAAEPLLLVSFGLIATIFKFAIHPRAPQLIGFILGPMLENNFSRAVQVLDGISFIWERPMTLGPIIFALILMVLPSVRSWLRQPERGWRRRSGLISRACVQTLGHRARG